MQTDASPLKIERDALGAVYYWIDNNALDLARIDYSDLYETYMTPIEGQLFGDCTQLFIDGKLHLEPTFLKTYSYWGDYTYDAPVNGILGNDFKRIEVYFYPDVVKSDSVTYSIRGRTKVKKNVCDFREKSKSRKSTMYLSVTLILLTTIKSSPIIRLRKILHKMGADCFTVYWAHTDMLRMIVQMSLG